MSKIELDRNNKTLYGQIADILRERIMSGEFKPGDILPSERELAEEMQVSRIPVREAMKSLEYLGVSSKFAVRAYWCKQLISATS